MASRLLTVSLAVAIAALSAGCAMSPPKSPVPDESRRVPANDRRELALLSCTTDLTAAKIEVAEVHRLVDRATATAGELQVANARLAATVQSTPRAAPGSAPMQASPSRIFVAFHRTNSQVPELTEEQAVELASAARGAALIEIRGRTDGQVESPAESRIARLRAEHMQDWLIRAGGPANRIIATWQPVGDHLGENSTPDGRALNRRVEVEVYAVAPVRSLTPRNSGAVRPVAATEVPAAGDLAQATSAGEAGG